MNCTDNQIRIEENQVILRGNAIPAVEVKDNEEDAPREISKGENESPRDDLKLDESLHVQLESNEQVIRAPLTPSQIRVGPQVMESEVQQLCDLLNEFRDCIAVKTDELGCMKTTPMEIMEVPGSKPVSHAPYRASYHEREVLRKIISELKRQGVIQDSNSEYSSPVLLVKKKTGDYRMVIDYRRLNAQTLKDKFPLPCIDDLLDKLNGYNLFCVLDAAQGFNQIPLHTESMRKAAFVTPDGHYEPTRLFFGLTNGPAVFQRAMVMALGDLLWNVVTCFVDDMLIGAKTFDEMMTRLRSVLMKLREAGVTLKISKCDFAMKEIEYLGFLISSKGVQPGPRKLAAVSEFPTPKNVRELRRFLGLTSFFRRFIERYALLASPLTQLLKKEAIFKWTTEHQKVFDELKRCLVSKPVLKLYDHRDITELHTDASSEGLAGMLLQYDKDNKLRLVYCVSRRTSPDEAMYHSSRLELIAAVWSMTRLRPLLIGKHFTLVTDCSAITFLNNQKNLKPQIARWAELLSEFDYEVKHRAGDKMCHVDALSRAPVEERNCTPDQEFDLTSPIELTDTPTAFYVYTENDRVALLQAQDKDLQNILQATRKPLGSRNQNERHLANQYCIENGILYRLMKDRGKTKKLFVMPKSMRKYLAVRYHDFSGHFGVDKVRQLIQEKFWFPNMTSYLKLHIRQCVSCAFIKVPAGKVQGKLNPIPPGRRPFEIIHIDFLGPLQKSSNRNSEVFVIIDNLTKFVRLRACKSCTTANVIKFLDEFVKDFGIPLRIISDRGTCFTSKAFVDFCKEKKLKHTLICSQRPQANGQVERINRILIPQIIASCKKENQKDWDKVLLDIQRQINWSPSKSTGKSPFELLYGYVPEQSNDFPVDLLPEEAIYNEPQTLQNEARHMISKSQTEMKKHYDRRHCPAIKYEIGDVVLVKRLPEQTGNSTKLQVRYRGPLVIDSVLPSDTYRLSDLRSVGQGRKRRANYVTTAHASQIKLFKLMDEDEQLSDLSDSDDDQQLDTKSDGGPSSNRMADCKQLQTCTCLPVPADEYRSAPPLNNNNKKK